MTGDGEIIEWAGAGVALIAGTESGDQCSVVPFDGGVLVGVIDGLGHGPNAAKASRAATDILEAHAHEGPLALVERCHEGLRRTRGAALTLASIHATSVDGASAELTWLGVGNVEGALLRRDRARADDSVVLRGGIVGLRLPALRATTLTLEIGDTLIFATDGIRPGFTREVERTSAPAAIAESILADHRSGNDDALVLVARYVGSPR